MFKTEHFWLVDKSSIIEIARIETNENGRYDWLSERFVEMSINYIREGGIFFS